MAERVTEPEDRQTEAEPSRGVNLPDQERFARPGESADGGGPRRRGRPSSSSPT